MTFPDYPFAANWFERDGLRQHYLDEGNGAPVLMLHGNPSWSYLWRRLVLRLRDQHRCIVPDHIGMGLSDKPGEDRYSYTLASRIEDLEALTEWLIRERRAPQHGWTLAMHDWGGAIGIGWARRHPERVARLVLLNTAAFPNPHGDKVRPPLRIPFWLLRDTRLGTRLFLRHNAFARGATRVPLGVQRRMPPEVRAAYLAPYDTPPHRLAIQRFVQDIPLGPHDRAWPLLVDMAKALPAFAHVPAFVGWGLRDPVLDPAFLREWRRLLPQAEVHTYRDAGHYVLEDAHEHLVPAIATFLAPFGSSARTGTGRDR